MDAHHFGVPPPPPVTAVRSGDLWGSSANGQMFQADLKGRGRGGPAGFQHKCQAKLTVLTTRRRRSMLQAAPAMLAGAAAPTPHTCPSRACASHMPHCAIADGGLARLGSSPRLAGGGSGTGGFSPTRSRVEWWRSRGIWSLQRLIAVTCRAGRCAGWLGVLLVAVAHEQNKAGRLLQPCIHYTQSSGT